MEVNLSRIDFVSNLVVPVIYPTPEDLLYVKGITGLEPVAANINTKGYGEQDGEYFIGHNIGKRNIVITFGLSTIRGSTSVGEARDLLYGYCSPKGFIKLIFHTDNFDDVAIEGYVESMTPNRFSQDPEIQLSVICPKPNFTAMAAVEVAGFAGINPIDREINYPGTVSTGIIFKLDMNDAYNGPIILEHKMQGSNAPYNELSIGSYNHIQDSYPFIDTNYGHRIIHSWYLGSFNDNLLPLMGYDSIWIFFHSGVDLFRVRTPNDNVSRTWHLSFIPQYGGI